MNAGSKSLLAALALGLLAGCVSRPDGGTCVADEVCVSANACKVGATTCPSATGAPACVDTGDKVDGTSCGGTDVC